MDVPKWGHQGLGRRHRSAVLIAAAALACLTWTAVLASRPLAAEPQTSARRQVVENETHFHLVGPPGTEIDERGTTTGTYPGASRTHLNFEGGTMRGTFSMQTTGGRVVGKTNATVTGKSAQPVVSFVGTATITGGTGRYKTARGTLKLTGTIRRSNYAIDEKTTGRVHF